MSSDQASKDQLLSVFQALDDSYEDRENFVQGVFNYTGNKKESLEFTLPLLPYMNTFCDVFGGSGVITLNRKKSRLDVYNDKHSGFTAFYKAIQTRPYELIERLELMPHGREFFSWCKETIDSDQDDVIRGAKWYYLVQLSFAGIGRNFGRALRGDGKLWKFIHNNLPLFPIIHERFKSVQVECLDWRTMFKDYDSPETVWYLDPPYYGSNIYKHKFSDAEHWEMCQKIFSLQGFVALAGFDNPVYDKFDWDAKHFHELTNTIECVIYEEDGSKAVTNSNYGEKRFEYLWIKEAY